MGWRPASGDNFDIKECEDPNKGSGRFNILCLQGGSQEETVDVSCVFPRGIHFDDYADSLDELSNRISDFKKK
jgi:hypothetical protein